MIEENEIIKQLKRVQKLKAEKFFVKIYNQSEVKKFIVNLNTDQLRYDFINSNGVQLSSVGGDYSPVTIEISAAKGRPKSGRSSVDLYDTGKFQRSFKVSKVDGKGFVIDANDPNDLEGSFGRDIYGLSADSIELLTEKVLPIWQKMLLNYLLNGSIS